MVKLHNTLVTLLLFFLTTNVHGQSQKGIDINGSSTNDSFGYSVAISSDGTTLAIGAPGLGAFEGYVRIYYWDGSWIQKGTDLVGEATWDRYGCSVTLSSDGNTVAIGANLNAGTGPGAGHVRVHKWDGETWIEKGLDIDGEAESDNSGVAVSISADGNVIAIGANRNDGTGEDAGHVRIYFWGFSSWIQKGSDIDGEAEADRSGTSVALSSDGNTVAIGAIFNNEALAFQGHARIYFWDGSDWIQKGSDIDGEGEFDSFGRSISISDDGNTVAIGSADNSDAGLLAGHVRIYEWSGLEWIQKGSDIDGEAAGDRSGESVALSSNGNIVAIGAPKNNGVEENSGHVRIYKWSGAEWVQKGIDIDGENEGDWSGTVSISGDGNTVAIGAKFNDETAEDAGQVRVFEFCEDIANLIDIDACNSYTVPSGDTTYLTSGVFLDTISRMFDCGDSILTINLTINELDIAVSMLAFDTLQANASGVDLSYQWINCADSSAIAEATSQIFVPLVNGNYAVIISQDGCIDTSACYQIVGLGVIYNEDIEIDIYPNPSSGIVSFEAGDIRIESIRVYNSIGELLMIQTISANKGNLDFNVYERGIYIIVIETSEGLLRRKLMLQ